MRIVLTSDIHYFPKWSDNIHRFADTLANHSPDLLIIAGDIGEPLENFHAGLEIFSQVCENRALVAGNHDVWHRANVHTSEELWHTLLGKAAQEQGYIWLDRKNIVQGQLGICGTVAWYDYGGKHPQLELDDVFYERIKSKVSNDANYIDWPWTDHEFASRVSDEFIPRLDALEDDPGIEDVLVVTHVPLFRECLKPIHSVEQGVLNAYYANISLGQQVLKRDKVRSVISGHVHQNRQLAISRCEEPDCKTPDILVHTIPSEYGWPAAILLDTDTWEVEPLSLLDPSSVKTGCLSTP